LVYDIPVRDDSEIGSDGDDDLFNIRLLNIHTGLEGIDLYYSESNESFNKADLLAQANYTQMAIIKK
jgi:hypothetical protein